jgi:hypothetical protein
MELRAFFDELKDCYLNEKHDFIWEWEQVCSSSDSKRESAKDFVYYIAFNLSKNILHGPLPSHLHSRMILESNKWGKKYCEFMEGK